MRIVANAGTDRVVDLIQPWLRPGLRMGEVLGVKDPLRLMEEIPNKAQSLLGIVVDVNLKSEAGGEYLEIRVDPYPNPISYRGGPGRGRGHGTHARRVRLGTAAGDAPGTAAVLPSGAVGSPMTCRVEGRQHVALTGGGGPRLIALALPA